MVKILSNFDTGLMDRLVTEYNEKFGKDNVIFVRRDHIFFIFRVIIPAIVRFLFFVLLLILMYAVFTGEGKGIFRWIAWIMIICTFLYVAYTVAMAMLDYYLDFTIITPNQITYYNQSGIFSRSTRSLDISKIKSVRVDQKGAIRSLWNFGVIVFLSEGDRQDLGDITLTYISNPNKLKDRIREIFEKYSLYENKEEK